MEKICEFMMLDKGKIYNFVKSTNTDKLQENIIFFCKNIKKFEAAGYIDKCAQEIVGFTKNIFLTKSGYILHVSDVTDDDLKKVTESLPEFKGDTKKLIDLCSSTMEYDRNLLHNLYSVKKYQSIDDISTTKTQISLIEVEKDSIIVDQQFLQIVDCYDEGYIVQHIQLSPELVAACNSRIIKDIYFPESSELKSEDEDEENPFPCR